MNLNPGETALDQRSFQDLIQGNHCWGCGTVGEPGLRIKSYWSGDESVCTWSPKDYHSAAHPQVLNGGIIASIIDCHCICTAIAAAYREGGTGDRHGATHLVRDGFASGHLPAPELRSARR